VAGEQTIFVTGDQCPVPSAQCPVKLSGQNIASDTIIECLFYFFSQPQP